MADDTVVVLSRSSKVMIRRLAPFAGASFLGLGLAVIGSDVKVVELALSVVVTVLLLVVAVAVPWTRAPSWLRAVPPFGYLLAVALLRDAAGGASTGLAALMLIPVFWVALYGTRAQLVSVLVATAAVFYVPMFVIGAPAYPATTWRGGAMFVVVGAIIGFTVQGLIARLRAVLNERARLLEQLQELAGTDPLTGAANRRAWDEGLERAIASARRT